MMHLSVADLDQLSEEARRSPRLRAHRNLHREMSDPCQRLVNAIEPDSYVPPHRHIAASGDETLLALRGSFNLVFFDDTGEIGAVHRLGDGEHFHVFQIPPHQWHTLIALESASVAFETKAGPYNPATARELAPWAPGEGGLEAHSYLERLKQRVSSFNEIIPLC